MALTTVACRYLTNINECSFIPFLCPRETLFPFYRWRNWERERLSYLPKSIKRVWSRAGNRAQIISGIPNQFLNHKASFPFYSILPQGGFYSWLSAINEFVAICWFPGGACPIEAASRVWPALDYAPASWIGAASRKESYHVITFPICKAPTDPFPHD